MAYRLKELKIESSKYKLEANDEEKKALNQIGMCEKNKNKPHIISNHYWVREKDAMCNCLNCDLSFLKGHLYLIPQGVILIEEENRRKFIKKKTSPELNSNSNSETKINSNSNSNSNFNSEIKVKPYFKMHFGSN